jgi:hypothetical protein
MPLHRASKTGRVSRARCQKVRFEHVAQWAFVAMTRLVSSHGAHLFDPDCMSAVGEGTMCTWAVWIPGHVDAVWQGKGEMGRVLVDRLRSRIVVYDGRRMIRYASMAKLRRLALPVFTKPRRR